MNRNDTLGVGVQMISIEVPKGIFQSGRNGLAIICMTIAIDRYGQGEEVAGMVSDLASPEAAFVTGASLKIDGGYAA